MQNTNSKRAMSKKAAIENEIARHKKAVEDIVSETNGKHMFYSALMLPAALGTLAGLAIGQISAM